MKQTGKTFKEIKAGLICTKCEKLGHIAPDCKSDVNPAPKVDSGGEKTDVGRKRGKNNGEKINSAYAAGRVETGDDVSGLKSNTETVHDPFKIYMATVDNKSTSRFNNIVCYSLDSHANVCIYRNAALLKNIQKVKPISIEGVGGMKSNYSFIGIHDLFGDVIYSQENKYNTISPPKLQHLGTRFEFPTETTTSASLVNCPLTASDLGNARTVHGTRTKCMEGKPQHVTGTNSSMETFI